MKNWTCTFLKVDIVFFIDNYNLKEVAEIYCHGSVKNAFLKIS